MWIEIHKIKPKYLIYEGMAAREPRNVDFSRMYEDPDLLETFRREVGKVPRFDSDFRYKPLFLNANEYDIFSDHARPLQMVVGTEYYHAEATHNIFLRGVLDRHDGGRRFYLVPNFKDNFRRVGRYVGERRFGYGDGGRVFYDFKQDDDTIISVQLSYEGHSLFITGEEYGERLLSFMKSDAWTRRSPALMAYMEAQRQLAAAEAADEAAAAGGGTGEGAAAGEDAAAPTAMGGAGAAPPAAGEQGGGSRRRRRSMRRTRRRRNSTKRR